MQAKHLLLAILVVIVWGINFVVTKICLQGFPPLLLCAVRFFLAVFPAIFFLPKPKASWKLIAAFGLMNFALQFAFMFTGLNVGMPPGLASLVLQTQAFFTMGLAGFLFKERPSALKLGGALISFVGICIVAFHAQGTPVLFGFMLTLLAAFCWASGNIVSKRIASPSPLSLVVWGSLYAFPPIMILSLIFEGPQVFVSSFANLQWTTVAAVFYLVFLSTFFGYSIWGFLMNTYPAATVAPFSLLIPIVGFSSSSLFMHEDFPMWKLGASVLVILGVAINVFEGRIKRVFSAN